MRGCGGGVPENRGEVTGFLRRVGFSRHREPGDAGRGDPSVVRCYRWERKSGAPWAQRRLHRSMADNLAIKEPRRRLFDAGRAHGGPALSDSPVPQTSADALVPGDIEPARHNATTADRSDGRSSVRLRSLRCPATRCPTPALLPGHEGGADPRRSGPVSRLEPVAGLTFLLRCTDLRRVSHRTLWAGCHLVLHAMIRFIDQISDTVNR